MKKIYFLSLLLGCSLMLAAQQQVKLPKNLKNIAIPDLKSVREGVMPLSNTVNPYVNSAKLITESQIGTTFYDLQSNTSAPSNRFYRYEDGTMAGVWTMGQNTGGYPDRGTGYNYFDGAAWQAEPAARIETARAGWPTYAPQNNGEIVVTHHDIQGLIVNRNEVKGAGNWTQQILAGPTGAADISWPRMVSSGENHENIHLLAMTYSAYQNLDLALLYYRSTDGGATWDKKHEILPGMTSSDYTGFAGDTYAWAEPKGDNLAFVVCDNWSDLIVMKSTDNGETWEKSVIWEHPYPMWNNTPADTFYCPDGAAHAAFDNNGKLHVVFGVNRAMFEEGATAPSWFPFVDGLAYWNEDMESWTGGDHYALDPDALFESGNLIGWMQDVDNNGSIELIGTDISNIGLYYVSPSSMPQITIDENNFIYVIYSSLTETFDNGTQQYRHIWGRGSVDGGNTWEDFKDLTGDIMHMFDECVFPTIANRTSAGQFYYIYQADNEPGLALRGDEDTPSQNIIYAAETDKSELVSIGVKNIQVSNLAVSQNYPNPADEQTTIGISLTKPSVVEFTINDLTGRGVYKQIARNFSGGDHLITVNTKQLAQGVYTYTVNADGNSITRKMVVK